MPVRIHLGVKRERTRMGGHNHREAESHLWCVLHGKTLTHVAHTKKVVEETLSEGNGINQAFYAHTHAGFTHSKNRPRLSKGPILALPCKNEIDGTLSFLTVTLAPNTLGDFSYSSLKNETAMCKVL